MKVIAIDLIGGDQGFSSSYPAVVQFAKKNLDWKIIGYITEETKVPQEKLSNLEIRYSKFKIPSDASSLEVVRKKDSTMVESIMTSVNKEAGATISAGASGPLVTASFLYSKPINKSIQPAFATMYSGAGGSIKVLLDSGANLETSVKDLTNFALMGEIFIKAVYSFKEVVKIGLLNIGIEKNKGDKLRQETYKALKEGNQSFIGNVEAIDALFTDADVIVTDAYSGNIALKAMEGVFIGVDNALRNVTKKPFGALGILIAKKALKVELKNLMQRGNIGGATVLGVNDLILKVHGSAKTENFIIALETAKRLIETNLIFKLKESFSSIKEFKVEESIEQKEQDDEN